MLQQSQSDKRMSVCSLTQPTGKGSPYKRLDSVKSDSVKSDRSSVCADDDSRRVSFDVEEPGKILTLCHISTVIISYFNCVLLIIQRNICFIGSRLQLLRNCENCL